MCIRDRLRTAHSRVWTKRYFALAQPMLQGATVPLAGNADPDLMDCNALYDLRRDAEGVSYARAAKTKTPPPSSASAAFTHLKLLQAGATQHGAWLKHKGQSVRVVNGAGQDLNSVEGQYNE